MSVTQINGGTQIKANTVTSGQVDTTVIVAGGGNAFTGDQSMGNHKITSLATPTLSTDAATKAYVDATSQGLDTKPSARAVTNTETLTIASGSVTQITGTTVDGVSPAINDYILIPNAPAATGAAGGATFTTQPANGLYKVSNATTNLTVARAPEQSGTIQPAGDYVFVEAGTYAGGGFVVTTPSAASGFIYGTNNIVWTQFTGAGEITVDSTITKTGNALSRAALTGDVTASGGSNATTIAAAAVSLSKMANLAANSVIGNSTGGASPPTAVPMTAAATASTVAFRDATSTLWAATYAMGVTTTVTSAATKDLSSPLDVNQFQQFTGTTTHTLKLQDAVSSVGRNYYVVNRSTGAVTVQNSSSSTLQVMQGGSSAIFTQTSNSPGPSGTWDVSYDPTLTVDSSLVRTNDQLSRAALTGDVTASAGSNATTIATGAVTLAKMATLASGFVIGNLSGSTATPYGIGATYDAATGGQALVLRTADGWASLHGLGITTQTRATAGGTTTLNSTSKGFNIWTGSSNQTVTMPAGGAIPVGAFYMLINKSSGSLTIQDGTGGALTTMAAGTRLIATITDNSTTAGVWDISYNGTGTVTSVSVVSANGFAGTVATASSTPAITLTTSITGILKGNGTAISAAAASTDYMAPASFVTRETPSGTVNGSNVTFTLANTPLSGTEEVFLNGILQEPGAGNDYTISSATITYLTAPLTGDKVRVNYRK